MGQKQPALFCLKNDASTNSSLTMKRAYTILKLQRKWFKLAIFIIALILPVIPFVNYTMVPELRINNINMTSDSMDNASFVYNEENSTNFSFKPLLTSWLPILHPFFLTFSLFYITNFATNVFWEWRIFMHRYENFKSLLKNICKYHPNYEIAIFLFFLSLLLLCFCQDLNVVCFGMCFCMLIVINNYPITSYEYSKIQQTQKLDPSRALAEWYYRSYLERVLSLDTDAPFKRRIEVFEDIEGVTISVHKLIILMPTSCFVHNNLEDSDPQIEYRKNLLDLNCEHASNRTFRTSVYRVKTEEGKGVHFLAELAAPLKNANDTHIAKFTLSKSEKFELVSNFYLHLKELLDSDLKLAGSYILVPYVDQDKNGNIVKLSQVILNAIEKEIELTSVVSL